MPDSRSAKDLKQRSIDNARGCLTCTNPRELPAKALVADHGGAGSITFRRLFDRQDLGLANFVDFTQITAGASIGSHRHSSTLEIYLVLAGRPLVTVDGRSWRMEPGGISAVAPGGTHSLLNDTDHEVEILVVEVGPDEK